MTNLTFLLSIEVGRPKGQSVKFLIIMWCVPLSFTVTIVYHACGSLSRVLGKIIYLFIFAFSLDKMLGLWYNKNYARQGRQRAAQNLSKVKMHKNRRACALPFYSSFGRRFLKLSAISRNLSTMSFGA